MTELIRSVVWGNASIEVAEAKWVADMRAIVEARGGVKGLRPAYRRSLGITAVNPKLVEVRVYVAGGPAWPPYLTVGEPLPQVPCRKSLGPHRRELSLTMRPFPRNYCVHTRVLEQIDDQTSSVVGSSNSETDVGKVVMAVVVPVVAVLLLALLAALLFVRRSRRRQQEKRVVTSAPGAGWVVLCVTDIENSTTLVSARISRVLYLLPHGHGAGACDSGPTKRPCAPRACACAVGDAACRRVSVRHPAASQHHQARGGHISRLRERHGG